jgi:hypothetical protein
MPVRLRTGFVGRGAHIPERRMGSEVREGMPKERLFRTLSIDRSTGRTEPWSSDQVEPKRNKGADLEREDDRVPFH